MESVTLPETKRYRDIPHRSSNEALKVQTNLTCRLSETAAEFIQKLAAADEQHGQHLASIVKQFRKKTQEHLRKDALFTAGSHFKAWETLLDETEQEAKSCSELSHTLSHNVSQQLLEVTARKKQLMKRWFTFREGYMSRVDKTEDHVQKLFRDYQDQWSKYAEGVEKDNVKESVMLHSYNSHNDYILALRAFNSLHDEFYGKQIYDMLDELQAIHEDLVKGFRTCLQNHTQVCQEKLDVTLTRLSSFLETVNTISAPTDISEFVEGQDLSVKYYPPPKSEFKRPELPPPKNPDTPPVDLTSLTDQLQLVDMTQSPLSHAHDSLKQKEFDLSGGLDKLHTEYQSVKTLLDSYRENPSLGDPNTLIEELLEMRNKIRVKEAELVMVRGKIQLFTGLSSDDSPESIFQRQSLIEDSATSSISGRPRKSSEIFVSGKNHDFIESTAKMPVFCGYCDGMIQPPITKGLRCKGCKMSVHHKCQNYIPYCSGQAPVKSSPKLVKVPKRISMMLTRKLSSDPPSSSPQPTSKSPESIDEEDETLGGLYEAPLPMALPSRPNDRMKKMASASHVPKPPPRGESLDPNRYSHLEDVFTHNSFEDTVELANSYSYCVALYDYSKVNPNDMDLEAGEVIELVNTGSSEWWKGTAGRKKGYFPASYVQLLSPGDSVMRAIYGFTPQSNGEIAIDEGQIIVMTRNDGDGWLFGKAGEQEGLFPENYVERLASI